MELDAHSLIRPGGRGPNESPGLEYGAPDSAMGVGSKSDWNFERSKEPYSPTAIIKCAS